MNLSRFAPLAILTAAAVSLTGCAANESFAHTDGADPAASAEAPASSTLSGTLNGVGSSAQGGAQTVWIRGFQLANALVTINYDPQGSGAGRTSLISGAAAFAGSDAALSEAELAGTFAACAPETSALDLPVYISPIAIAYNVPGLDNLKLDAPTIAAIFKGDLTTWNDSAIARQNPNAKLPDAPITVVHRSDDSGTTQNFTEYLSANAKEVWDAAPSQSFPYNIGDAAKGTSGVADATRSATNTITYIDESGASGLSTAQLLVGDNYESISAEGAAAVVAASPLLAGRNANDLAIAIDRTNSDEGAWPLVLVSYLALCQQYQDPVTAELMKAYAGFIASDAAQSAAAKQAGSAPLSADLAARVQQAIATIK